ncbi:MAG: serine hydrolase [Pseudoflavonifractor sp.]|nr:serine hydrolase [Alloprevotella sp.]MCM1117143.1 serine hydrolase [Pseudoflavonifractor sp.]
MFKILHMLGSLMMMLLAGPQAQLPADIESQTLKQDVDMLSSQGQAWVDSVYDSLSDRQRVAQLFVPHLVISDNAAGRAVIDRMCGIDAVGGILLSKESVMGYARLINYAQGKSKTPLLVTLDGEWGLAMRIKDAPRFPYNMALGAIRDPKLLYDYGAELARECRELGIQVDFAPVLDVNSNPLNPVIGFRSYGENPRTVSRLGVAFSKGMESGGVMSVSKHFPGHGDTSADSHKTLPTVDHSLTQMKETDLLPFADYIEAGLSGVMVGHLNVPSIDPSGTPASLSKPITTGLLKEKMGFDGMIWTDALEMKGAAAKGMNNCVAALMAGADLLLGSASPSADIDAVMKAIDEGKISKKDIESRCRKMLAYKYVCGLANYRPVNTDGLIARINSPRAADLNQELSDAVVTLLANRNHLVPVPNLEANRVAVVSIGASVSNEFADLCVKYVDCPSYGITAEHPLSSATLAKLRDEADIVVIGVFSDKPWAREAYSRLSSLPKTIPVFFINPYKMASFKALDKAPELMALYDDTPALRRAGAMGVFGGIIVDGRFPVNVSGVAKAGDGLDLPKTRLGYASPQAEGFSSRLVARVDSIVAEAIKAKAFPGCQVLIAKGGNVVMDKCFGRQSYGAESPLIDSHTLYDIASMSKATATVSGVMKAYDEGLLGLDTPLASVFPELKGSPKASITVRELLYHESGMPAVLNINRLVMDTATFAGPLTTARPTSSNTIKISSKMYGHKDARPRTDLVTSTPGDAPIAKGLYATDAAYDTIMSRIFSAPLRSSKKYNYSCLNFALLSDMQQRLTGVDFDQWIDTEIFGPLGANLTGYRPSLWYDTGKIAPTEADPFLRRQTVKGYVHDEMAAFAGGVLGNAGLFSTAGDIAKYAQMLLNGGHYGDRQILKPETVALFTTTKSPTAQRTLGYDLVGNYKSLSDTGAPLDAYGHTGFTGTCFWIDPHRQIIFIFLSNRVHTSRDNPAFSRLNPRAAILKAIYSSLN